MPIQQLFFAQRMLKKNSKIVADVAGTIVIVLFLDQASKFIVLRYFNNIASFNSGGAFGVGRNIDGYVYISLALVVVSVFMVLFSIRNKPNLVLPFSLIMSGASSNLLDRILRSHVVDFIDPKIWPSFNIADSAIFVGAVLIVWTEFRRR